MAAEERWAMLLQASLPSQLGTSTLGSIFSLPGPGLLWERSHTPNPHRLLKSLFHQPLANCSCSQDAHLHSRTQWLGNGPQKTQVETKAGQTHQLFEEGSFLVLLRIALILVQAILQLQREGVIVGSHYL